MHNENEFNDTLLNEAFAAMQNAPVPDGPSADTMRATLSAIERIQQDAHQTGILARIGLSLRRHRKAACIVVPLPIAAAFIWLLVPSLGPARHATAFAAVLQQIRSAETIQFRVAYSTSGQPTQTRRVLCKGDRTRVEFDQGPITIFDPAARRILTLMPDVHKAFLAPMPPDDASTQASDSSLFSKIRNLQNVPGAYRGVREEDGRQLDEFQTEQKGIQFNIFADPQNDQPVRITMEVPLFEASLLMSDFVFDAELNDDLFSLTPPTGYDLTEQPNNGDGVIASDPDSGQSVSRVTVTMSDADLAEPVEQDVVECLRALAELHQGQFPSQLVFNDLMNNLATSLAGRMQSADQVEQQEMTQQIWQCFLKWRRAKSYFKNLEIEPVYTGEGVKQGEAKRAVLTWTIPGKSQARIVYGDLSIKDADPVPDTKAADDASEPVFDFSAPSEQDVINYLRYMAEQNGGVFPSADELAALMRKRATQASEARKGDASEKSRAELQDYASYIMAQMRATKHLASVNAVQPTPIGRGTKLGDSQRPVFMWGLSDQKHIRVVYGDLKARTLDLNGDTLASLLAFERETATKPAQPPPASSPASERVPNRKDLPSDAHTLLQPGKIAELPWYGFNLAEKSSQPGLLINTIYDDSPDNSPAIKAGLHAKDILTHINGSQVSSRWEANQLIKKSRPGDKVELTVRRGPELMMVPLVVGHWPRHSRVVPDTKAADDASNPGSDFSSP